MGYFSNTIGLIWLDEEVYMRVVSDKKAFWKVITLDLLTIYPLMLIAYMIASFFLIIFNYSIAQQELVSFTKSLWIMAGAAFFIPLFIVLGFYIAYLVPFFIGRKFGGISKYNDFYKVVRYPQPILGRLATIIGLGIFPAVYYFIILFKAYEVVMGLDKTLAKKAVWWNLGVIGMLIIIMFLAVIFGILV